MNEQPEALRLADELAIQNQYDFYKVCEEAAAELRRLHEENERLREEVRVLRLYGNKDCTSMADEALKQEQPPVHGLHLWQGF